MLVKATRISREVSRSGGSVRGALGTVLINGLQILFIGPWPGTRNFSSVTLILLQWTVDFLSLSLSPSLCHWQKCKVVLSAFRCSSYWQCIRLSFIRVQLQFHSFANQRHNDPERTSGQDCLQNPVKWESDAALSAPGRNEDTEVGTETDSDRRNGDELPQ